MVQPLFSAFSLKACFRAWGAAMATLLLGASCTQDLPGDDGNGDAAISFSAPAVTRAAVESFQTGDAFSVWGWYNNNNAIGNPNNAIGNPFSGETVTNNGSAWSYTGGLRYWVLGAEYDFYAVYPATGINASCEADGTITVTGFDASATGEGAVDLMTASKTDILADESTAGSPVGLEFEHELAKVSVVLRTDPGVTANLTNASLYGVSLTGDFSRNLHAGGNAAWANLGEPVGQANTPFKASGISLNANESGDIFTDLLLIPQSVTGLKLTINLRRNGSETVSQTLDLGTSTLRWVAGQAYRYVLTVRVDAITFSDFTVPVWEESGTGGNVNIGSDNNN